MSLLFQMLIVFFMDKRVKVSRSTHMAVSTSEFKDLDTVSAFKTVIRKWKPNNYSCRLCKTYIGNVGFI